MVSEREMQETKNNKWEREENKEGVGGGGDLEMAISGGSCGRIGVGWEKREEENGEGERKW